MDTLRQKFQSKRDILKVVIKSEYSAVVKVVTLSAKRNREKA